MTMELSRKNNAFLKALGKGAGKSRGEVMNDILDALGGLPVSDRMEIRDKYLLLGEEEELEIIRHKGLGEGAAATEHSWKRDMYKKIGEVMRYSLDYEGMLDKSTYVPEAGSVQ